MTFKFLVVRYALHCPKIGLLSIFFKGENHIAVLNEMKLPRPALRLTCMASSVFFFFLLSYDSHFPFLCIFFNVTLLLINYHCLLMGNLKYLLLLTNQVFYTY